VRRELEALRAEVAKLRAIVIAQNTCVWCRRIDARQPSECFSCEDDQTWAEQVAKETEWAEMRATIEAIIEEEPQR
jgi:hypothetical protein